MPIHTSSIIISPALDAQVTSIAEAGLKVGQVVKTTDNGEAVLVQAGSEIAQYNAVIFQADSDGTVINLTTAAAAEGTGQKRVGWAQTSIASGNFGWVQTSGRPLGKAAANCADAVILFTTSTAGVVDDATVSASLIAGVTSETTISNATAVTLQVPTNAYVHPYVNPA